MQSRAIDLPMEVPNGQVAIALLLWAAPVTCVRQEVRARVIDAKTGPALRKMRVRLDLVYANLDERRGADHSRCRRNMPSTISRQGSF